MKCAIVMGVHNALDYVKGTLEDLKNTVPNTTPLGIIDDSSDEETWGYLKNHEVSTNVFGSLSTNQFAPRITVLRNERQQLFTRTYNRGIRYAYHNFKPEVIVCINSDLQLKTGWLDWILKGFADTSVGMVGYRDQFDAELWKKKAYTEQKRPEYVTGHCIGFRVKMLEEVGVFCETDTTGRDDPTLKPYLGQAHIGSDRLLSYRANIKGWKTLYVNFPGCSHTAGQSWQHNLKWLSEFQLDPLWEPTDTLDEPEWYE